MLKKILIIISLSTLIIAAASLLAIYYFCFFSNKPTSNNLIKSQEQNQIFSDQEKLPEANQEVSLIAVGDISYSRQVAKVVRLQKDIYYPFLKIQDYLKSADMVFGNLETSITPGREIETGEMIFRSNPGTEQVLKDMNFSVVSLANNHTPNFGAAGLLDTFKYLDNAGIKYIGAGKNSEEANRPVYIEKNGIKFAFLAYNDSDVVPVSYEASSTRAGTAFMRLDKMAEAVKLAKQNADLVIISMHSGTEYVPDPNTSQINFAHAAIDAGADLVIGHHPHVVQTAEKYKDKYIFYSLGNFIFDQMWSRDTKEGLAVKIYFNKQGVSKFDFLPVVIENFSQPRPADSAESAKILNRLKIIF